MTLTVGTHMNAVPQNLQIAYIKSARSKIATLNRLWDNAIRNNWKPESVRTLSEMLFRIKGSGGIYGYPALSDAADRLYRLINESDTSNTKLASVDEARHALEQQLELIARDGNGH